MSLVEMVDSGQDVTGNSFYFERTTDFDKAVGYASTIGGWALIELGRHTAEEIADQSGLVGSMLRIQAYSVANQDPPILLPHSLRYAEGVEEYIDSQLRSRT